MALTRSLLENVAQPFEQLLRHKKVDELDANLKLQEDLSYVFNHEDMTEGVPDALAEVASLPTFEERSARAEQFQIVYCVHYGTSTYSSICGTSSTNIHNTP